MPRGSSEQKGSSFLYISNKNSSDKKTESSGDHPPRRAQLDDEKTERTIVNPNHTDVKEKLLLVMIFVVLVGYGEVA